MQAAAHGLDIQVHGRSHLKLTGASEPYFKDQQT